MLSANDTGHVSHSSITKHREEAYIASHIEELKDKMRILQNDRKATIDVLEANKQANREDIRVLRDENKEFRQRLAFLQRTVVQDNEKDEQKQLERQVDSLRRELDDLKARSMRTAKTLEVERDKARSLELDSQRPHMEDNEHTRRIRSLENKLDKAMIKYNEAQSIKKTYEQIVNRLQEERVGYDNQLSIMERTLNAKKRDFEELIVLSGDSLHAKELAGNELERVRNGYEEERRRREKELKERYNVIQLRKQMLNKIKEREKIREQLEEEYGRSTSEANALAAKRLITEKLEQKNKIEIFENAFRKIKEATGVSDVNEVISKLVSQESTTENLVALTQENQRKLEILLDEKKELKERVEEMKYNGLSGGVRRKLVDDSEDQLANSLARLERNRMRYDRLNKLIISVKAGVGHLQDKLYNIRYDGVFLHTNIFDDEVNNDHSSSVAGGGANAVMGAKISSSVKPLELADDTVVDVLNEQEGIIIKLMKLVKEGIDRRQTLRTNSNGVPHKGVLNNDSNGSGSQLDGESVSLDEGIMKHSNQQPDDLSNFPMSPSFDSFYKSKDGDTAYFGYQDGDDEEITRLALKKQSTQIISAVEKKKKLAAPGNMARKTSAMRTSES